MSDDGADEVWSDAFGFDAGDGFDEVVHVLDRGFVEPRVVLHLTGERFLVMMGRWIGVDGDGFRRRWFLHFVSLFFFFHRELEVQCCGRM